MNFSLMKRLGIILLITVVLVGCSNMDGEVTPNNELETWSIEI